MVTETAFWWGLCTRRWREGILKLLIIHSQFPQILHILILYASICTCHPVGDSWQSCPAWHHRFEWHPGAWKQQTTMGVLIFWAYTCFVRLTYFWDCFGLSGGLAHLQNLWDWLNRLDTWGRTIDCGERAILKRKDTQRTVEIVDDFWTGSQVSYLCTPVKKSSANNQTRVYIMIGKPEVTHWKTEIELEEHCSLHVRSNWGLLTVGDHCFWVATAGIWWHILRYSAKMFACSTTCHLEMESGFWMLLAYCLIVTFLCCIMFLESSEPFACGLFCWPATRVVFFNLLNTRYIYKLTPI